MTISQTPEILWIALTPFQRDALIELVERSEIRGRDAALIVGILRTLGNPRKGAETSDAAVPAIEAAR